MNIKLTSLFSAVALALVATTTSSQAKVYTAATYQKELKAKLGKKTGAAAYQTAGNFLKQVLTDTKNLKLANTFAGKTNALLKKPVQASLQAKASAFLANALTTGYFKKGAYNPQDANFSKALTTFVKFVTQKNLKTAASGKSIYQQVYKVKGGKNTVAFQNFLNKTIYKALGLKTWPIIS